jgi:hypothetical protein
MAHRGALSCLTTPGMARHGLDPSLVRGGLQLSVALCCDGLPVGHAGREGGCVAVDGEGIGLPAAGRT